MPRARLLPVLAACLLSAAAMAQEQGGSPLAAEMPDDMATDGTEAAAGTTPEQAVNRRIGFYFGVRLTKLSTLGQANGIGYVVDPPAQPGFPFPVIGKAVDADIHSRLNLEFFVGFRLRTLGNVEASYMQWNEEQDLLTIPTAGKAIANTLASPLAGFDEDVDGDGDASGFEGGTASETRDTRPVIDAVTDGAEDVNFNGQADFVRFGTSDRIVGNAATNYQVFDVDFTRRLKQMRRFSLDWRAGLRVASLSQNHDIGYRDIGSFAVYRDDEPDRASTLWSCLNYRNPPPTPSTVQDGDGDGESTQTEADGDGFLDGNCNVDIQDKLETVDTVSEDRIVAEIRTRGQGIKLGLDGKFELTPKWRLFGNVAVSVVSSKTEYTYRESFTSERDRYLNFIDWDFNGDGVYNNWDLDFDNSCSHEDLPEECRITDNDGVAIAGSLGVTMRTGAGSSVVPNPRGLNASAYRGPNFGVLREGDPVGESERNRDTIKEYTQLHDIAGDASGIHPVLDLNVGFEWQFSRFANVGFGLRSTRWFQAGRFRDLADDVVAGRSPEGGGDFNMTGAYVTLTIVPR